MMLKLLLLNSWVMGNEGEGGTLQGMGDIENFRSSSSNILSQEEPLVDQSAVRKNQTEVEFPASQQILGPE